MPSELGKCPECQRWILIPWTAALESVECPWCREPLDLDKLDRVPVRALADTSEALPQIETGAAASIDSVATQDVVSPFHTRPLVAPKSSPTPRRHRPAVELFKIVAGGLAGLAIAQLMLWWVPALGRRDPLGLAPHMPQWLRFIVPPELRPAPAWPPPEREFLRPASDSTNMPPGGERHQRDSERISTPGGPPEITSGSIDSRFSWNAASLSTPPSDSRAVVRTALRLSRPEYSGEQLQQALARAVSALENLEQADGMAREDRLQLARNLYQRLCDVAQIASYVDLDDPRLGQRMNAVAALLERIGQSQSLLNLVGRASAGWLNFPARSSDGIAVSGEVVRIVARGRYWETELKLATKTDQTVRIITRVPPQLDPRSPYDIGSQLLLLGSIIDQVTELADHPVPFPVVRPCIHLLIDWPTSRSSG
jgi:hypothetical protein